MGWLKKNIERNIYLQENIHIYEGRNYSEKETRSRNGRVWPFLMTQRNKKKKEEVQFIQ